MAGLLGMGGMNGFSPDMGLQSLLGDAYDPAALRNMQIKRGLLGAGAAMLSQGPSQYPIGFGQMLGQGLGAGLNAAGQAQDDYMQQARTAYDVKRMGINDEWSQREQARKEKEWAEADKRKAAFDEMIGGLPEDQRGFAQAYPDEYAKQRAKSIFPENAERPEVFGTPIWGSDQKPYYVNKYGQAQPVQGIPDGVTVSDPYITSFRKSQGAKEGGNVGEANSNLVGARQTAEYVKGMVNEVRNDPSLGEVIGYNTLRPDMLSSNAMIDMRSKLDQLQGTAFLQGYQLLKGGGQVTEIEGQKAEDASMRVRRALASSDVKAVQAALDDYINAIDEGVRKLEAQAGHNPDGSPQAQPVPQPDASSGWIDLGGGAKMRRKQ